MFNYTDPITVECECDHCSAGKHTAKSHFGREAALVKLHELRTACKDKTEARLAYLEERRTKADDTDEQPKPVVRGDRDNRI